MTDRRSIVLQVVVGIGLGLLLVVLIYQYVFPIIFAGVRPAVEPVLVSRTAPLTEESETDGRASQTALSEPPPLIPSRTPSHQPVSPPQSPSPVEIKEIEPIPNSFDETETTTPGRDTLSELQPAPNTPTASRAWAAVRDRSIQERPLTGDGSVTQIVVTKSNRLLRAYSSGGDIRIESPCTIGRDGTSRATPEGEYVVGGTGVWLDPCHYASARLAAEEGYPENPVPPWRAYFPARTKAEGNPNSLGAAWIGLVHQVSGRTDIGIHGTNEPDMIGTDVSHGCIRLPNDTVLELARRVRVGLTRVTVKP